MNKKYIAYGLIAIALLVGYKLYESYKTKQLKDSGLPTPEERAATRAKKAEKLGLEIAQ